MNKKINKFVVLLYTVIFIKIYTILSSNMNLRKKEAINNALLLKKFDVSWKILKKSNKILKKTPIIFILIMFFWYNISHLLIPFIILFNHVKHVYSFIIINIISFLIYFIFPVIPPRLLSLEKESPIELINLTDYWFILFKKISKYIISKKKFKKKFNNVNQYAAFPSVHTAWAIWGILCSFNLNPIIFKFCLFHAVFTIFIIITFCHHYPIDILCGAVISFICFIFFNYIF